MTGSLDTSVSPSGATSNSALATLPTSRASPFPATTTAATPPSMTIRSYVSSGAAFRPVATSQASFASTVATANGSFDRDAKKPIGTPASTTPPTLSSARIRNLPLNTSEESLRLMLVFSEDLVDVEVLPPEQSPDKGFRAAILKFKTPAGAQEAKNILHGKSNISNDAELIVEILGNSSPTALSAFPGDAILPSASNGTVTTGPSTLSSRPTSRFNGTFQSLDKVSPPLNGAYGERASQDTGSSFQDIFGPQSPIGNRLANGTQVTSKTLIAAVDDDETKELLKDPVGFAENGLQRRQTAPQLPINRLANLSLNTNPGPSSVPTPMPYYAHTPSPSLSNLSKTTMSPTTMAGPAAPYAPPPMPSRIHHYPPANPADQNPPCNTLYVGNLPADTSEEELKAMFSKQRGYKRLCFRTKQNGPMCFVEFEDITAATRALKELYGQPLHNSTKGGIRLSFSKNPLGVRSNQNPQNPMNAVHGNTSGFTTASGPPPGLAPPASRAAAFPGPPPGLGGNLNGMNGLNGVNGMAGMYGSSTGPGAAMNPWSGMYNGYMTAGAASSYPAYMMGR
ncbi:hypothetical protein VTJ04DRAFT_7492 [Mycothermus thermophilus]|uniref:uncharacterized protein n=1 Tax=Humicola insolens TaxID=85995 RepID=UPI0037423B44